MTEEQLENEIRRILRQLAAMNRRVLGYHTRDSRRSPAGFPDWVFAGPGGYMFRELKAAGKQPTPKQREWILVLDQAGADVGVWWPEDFTNGTIARELASIAGVSVTGALRREGP